MMRTCFGFLLTAALACTGASTAPASDATPVAQCGTRLFSEDFSGDLSQWVVEQQPGGTVKIADNKMVIDDKGGCTVWFKERLEAPVVITCEVTVTPASRVSDMNFFWMATDPQHPEDLFTEGRPRNGLFGTYDSLRTYYVGYGGNDNTTTRFRRYDGTGARPLLPENDLSSHRFLLEPNHHYEIMLIAAFGHAQFVRDGKVIFDFADPEPLTSGWFAFRTVNSHIEINSFAVFEALPIT